MPELCSGQITNALRGVHAEVVNQVPRVGTNSLTLGAGAHHGEIASTESVKIPRNVGSARFSTAPTNHIRSDAWVLIVLQMAPPVSSLAPSLVRIHKDTQLVS